MKYLQLYINTFKKILDFKGKSDRTEFWTFVVISLIVSIVLLPLIPFIAGIYSIVATIAAIMLGIRRARDAGNVLLALTMIIPVVGLIVLGLLPSKR